ncbi:MAG TPA: hypothetical protein VF092_23565 [Longimicrobium sp.]
MKLPPMTLGHAAPGAAPAAGRARPHGAAGVAPQFDLGCLLGCGAGVLSCLVCGPNPACWLACAGPQAIGCITRCL